MKTNIDSLYKNMKPNELASIAFGAIGTENTSTWDACTANVSSRTYVELDKDYTRTIENQMDFSILAGLQFHKYALNVVNSISQRKENREEMQKAGLDSITIFKKSQELFDISQDSHEKYQIVLALMNNLCDQYRIDKTACLAFAEIPIQPKVLESFEMPDKEYWSDSVKKYHDDIKFTFEATIKLGTSKQNDD